MRFLCWCSAVLIRRGPDAARRGTAVARYWIRRSRADLFFQAGTRDAVVPHAQLLALERAAPGHPRVRWYDAGHVVDAPIRRDQLAWQAAELGLR